MSHVFGSKPEPKIKQLLRQWFVFFLSNCDDVEEETCIATLINMGWIFMKDGGKYGQKFMKCTAVLPSHGYEGIILAPII